MLRNGVWCALRKTLIIIFTSSKGVCNIVSTRHVFTYQEQDITCSQVSTGNVYVDTSKMPGSE